MAAASAYEEQIRAGNVLFVTKENQEKYAAIVEHLGPDQVQCDGCTRGDTPLFSAESGYHMHAAPVFENGMKGAPFRCLRVRRHA